MHKRRETGGKKKAWRKKRKYAFKPFLLFIFYIIYEIEVDLCVEVLGHFDFYEFCNCFRNAWFL